MVDLMTLDRPKGFCADPADRWRWSASAVDSDTLLMLLVCLLMKKLALGRQKVDQMLKMDRPHDDHELPDTGAAKDLLDPMTPHAEFMCGATTA